MTREELIEAASREAAGVILFSGIQTKADIATASDTIAVRILDLVEPIIRSDVLDANAAWARDRLEAAHLRAALTNLRAKMTEEREDAMERAKRPEAAGDVRKIEWAHAASFQYVIDLIDKGTG
jgi:folate-dependent tRNA-U54 methylase TrmFO/GidA